jgi:hypothetical protein
MLRPHNYSRLPEAAYATLSTNERINTTFNYLRIEEDIKGGKGPLDGYVVGIGNGTIWSMLEYFTIRYNIAPGAKGQPKGLISFETDPAVVLSGLTIKDYAREKTSIDTVISDIYSSSHKEEGVTIDPFIQRANRVIERERVLHPAFADELAKALPNVKQDLDQYTRIYGNIKYLLRSYKEGNTMLEGVNDISKVLYRNWETIMELEAQGNIAFIHSDIKNTDTLSLISTTIPDIQTSRNILYVSNVLDHLEQAGMPHGQQNFGELQTILNPGELSYYVSSRRRNNYKLMFSPESPDKLF